MRYQEASTTIGVPRAVVEQALEDVERWPAFLAGVAGVRRVSHERYVFELRDGRDCRETLVAVRHKPAAHCYTWRSLDGPRFAGRLELAAEDATHTRVKLAFAHHPGCLTAGLAEMLLPRDSRAWHNLRELEAHLLHARLLPAGG